MIDDELVLAARLVQPDSRPHQHFLAVPRGEGTQHISLPEHGAANLRGGVFEREIPVAGAGPGEIGDFRFQPQAAEAALQQHPDLAIEPRNTVNVAVRPCGREAPGLFPWANDSGLPRGRRKVQCAAS